MGKGRFYVALWAAKLSIIALKVTRHNGTNFPGVVALRLCPDFLRYAQKPKKIIAVTGTNGKTTVSNLLLDMLTMDGKQVLNNKMGSNINTGIATSLIQGATIGGRCRYEIGLFEVDERSALRIYPYMKPDLLLLTNLSRDSIMRNGHPEYIGDILTKYIPKGTKMIVNADDLLSCAVAPDNSRVYFGIEEMAGDRKDCINLINDMQICPRCHHKLQYQYLRYNHIGKAFCPACDYKAPEYDYHGCNVDLKAMTMDVRDAAGCGHYRLLNESVFNIYNVVSAVAVMRELGYDHAQIAEFFARLEITASRFDVETVGDKQVYRMLAKEKNAFATSRVFDYVAGAPGDKELILMNSCQGDMQHWSENTCWLYDCDFEFLKQENIKNIVLCGPRRADHKLRLLLAGVPAEKLSYAETEMDAPDQLLLFPDDHIYVFYGTDSIGLGRRVANKVKEKILKATAVQAEPGEEKEAQCNED